MPNDRLRKGAVALLIIGLAAAFYYLHLDRYLTLAHIKASQHKYLELYEGRRAAVIAGYMAVYILVTSLSLPGAAVMTLAGGALFGLATGTIVVSFASSIGATIACFVSRFLLREWVEARFRDRISRIDKGLQEEGAFYLFTLRLMPVFPFWLINLAVGVTKMRLTTFYWVSQAGMLPATLVYVNAGRELARIDSVRGIISPSLLGSLVLLGLFPLAAKKVVSWHRKRRRMLP